MTLSQPDLLEFLDTTRSGGDTDAVRQGAEVPIEIIGAAHYERTEVSTVEPPLSQLLARCSSSTAI